MPVSKSRLLGLCTAAVETQEHIAAVGDCMFCTPEGRAQGFAGARLYSVMKGDLAHLFSIPKIFSQLLTFSNVILVALSQSG